ncbi:alpha/beta hydrolase family protein [Parasphingorhabdus pacifica]
MRTENFDAEYTTPTILGEISAGRHRTPVWMLAQDDPTSPVAIVLPAMGVPAEYYRPFVRELHERGLTVVIFDLRGQGEAGPPATRGVRFGYKDLIEDLGAVVDLVGTAFPEAPRFLLGHSLGGHIAMLYAAEHPDRLDGIALIASGSVWFRSFDGAQTWRTLFGTQAVALLSTVLGYWPGNRFGFGGRQSGELMRDWARQARTGRYRLTRSNTDYEAALRGLALPLLTVSVAGDDLAPASSVDHLGGKAQNCTRSSGHYTPEVAGTEKLSHFSWVHSSGELARWIVEWLARDASAPDGTAPDGTARDG